MKKVIYMLATVIMVACNASPQENQSQSNLEESSKDALFNEVMAIHDEVMPEMGRIFRLQKALKQVIDSLETQKVSASISVDSLKNIQADLKEADDAMMNWMRSNDFQFENMEEEEIMQELASEKEKIIVVKDKMLNSIEQAEKVLQKFEQP
ncbi:hypothetical protein [Catalinimonas niigatensis]|uniref:hypothetical protein n=1 Tax=Catalinimonas niigatensis TaxID=1397264 RepID=UPI0026663910|nr:hypothetical protein [Catalinimonas niigatensis]WPP52470.1 hypothetical protein PZB72_08745 [Catalinimonas niigatensis]